MELEGPGPPLSYPRSMPVQVSLVQVDVLAWRILCSCLRPFCHRAPIPGDLYVENRVIATFRCTSWTCTWRLMAFVAGGADWGHWGMAGLGKSLWEGCR